MPIPENISREHVLKALKEIDINGVPKKHDARNTFLIYAGKRYPPKYVISLTNKYANGEFLTGFTTNEAVGYLKKLGFKIEKITLRKYPPGEFDRRMYPIFKEFFMLLEKRLTAVIEGRSELNAIWQESEDTIRYMMFYALTTVGKIKPLDVYLEYPHPEVPNRNYAKLDTFVAPAPNKNRPAIVFEMKFHKKINDNYVPLPNNAGAVFADILKLALFRKQQKNIKRYMLYVADENMIRYLTKPGNGYGPFLSLEENTGFKIAREYLTEKPRTFINQLKKITGEEKFPEPIIVCRFKRDIKLADKDIALRIYEVIPEE
jgi:hypothetical protein